MTTIFCVIDHSLSQIQHTAPAFGQHPSNGHISLQNTQANATTIYGNLTSMNHMRILIQGKRESCGVFCHIFPRCVCFLRKLIFVCLCVVMWCDVVVCWECCLSSDCVAHEGIVELEVSYIHYIVRAGFWACAICLWCGLGDGSQ